MEAIKSRIDTYLTTAMAPIDKQMRPLQRAYFLCCHDCSDDTKAAKDVESCVQRCVEPVSSVNSQLQSATQVFQQRLERCAQVSQEAIQQGAGEEARKEAFIARMRPCVEEELGKMGRLLDEVQRSIPAALGEVERLRREDGKSKQGRGLEVGEGKKGWW